MYGMGPMRTCQMLGLYEIEKALGTVHTPPAYTCISRLNVHDSRNDINNNSILFLKMGAMNSRRNMIHA